jgi:hypothetical protein
LAKVVEERSAELTEVKKKLAEKEQEAAAKAKEAEEFRAQVSRIHRNQTPPTTKAKTSV